MPLSPTLLAMNVDVDVAPPAKRRRTGSSTTDLPTQPNNGDDDMDIESPISGHGSSSDASMSRRWQRVIETTVPSIVSVRFMIVSAFDTEPATISEATGFIVDAERGLVLTNRHVVGAGPFVGTIIAHDHEEVEAVPIYRDPIHDFGVLKFDPSKIKYMPLRAIPLRPDLANVGLDIRVCGNDAGEKLSILAGSISRLDRNCPDYGELTYNDFNTFYLQAASSSSGGSSGSPVIDIHGNAVALQAGGATFAATNYFLPLDRIVRTLDLIRNGAPQVPRGTIQTRWLHRPYDEVRRLGLRPETEAEVRKESGATEIGMLVAENVVPETSPAYGLLEEGDVLVRVNGAVVTKFAPLEAILDDSINGTVTLDVERGGDPLSLQVHVGDLHAVTPDELLEVGGAKFNNLSYQLARFYSVPCRGVYVAAAGGCFRFAGYSHGLIIASVDAQPVATIHDMAAILQKLPDQARVSITFYSIADIHCKAVVVITLDKTWAPFRSAKRNDVDGLWHYTDLNAHPVPRQPLAVVDAVMPDYSLAPVAKRIMQSLVKVTASLPVTMDGFPKSMRVGYGLVVDVALGLVLVSRAHVPQDLVDLTVTFYDMAELPAKVLFVHPHQNLAVVQYPAQFLAPTASVVAAPLQRSPPSVRPGMPVEFIGLTDGQRPFHVRTSVKDVTLMVVPCSGEPRARAINFEGISVDTPASDSCYNGVLADPETGDVVALWLNFLGEFNAQTEVDTEYAMGLPWRDVADDVFAVVDRVRIMAPPVHYPLATPDLTALNFELTQVTVVKARTMGVSDEWLAKVQHAGHYHVLMVKRVESLSESDGIVHELDLVLAVNGELVTSVRDVVRAVQAAHKQSPSSTGVKLDLVRNKEHMQVTVVPQPLEHGTDRCVVWCGALIHPPHKAARQQCAKLPSGCYISARRPGSPAVMYNLSPTMFITHVAGRATPDLDALLAAVDGIADGTYVRVKLVSFDFVPTVVSVKICQHYFKTLEIHRVPGSENGWEKAVRAASSTGVAAADTDGDGVEPMDENGDSAGEE
ncbi:hypothetical protein BC828DRAFT_391513 [Blastocladiella britannica]|nr:hypothetical protein BC828DRAFT_391513 [Blastocladiella britannica]